MCHKVTSTKYSIGEVGCPLLCGAPGLCQGTIINFEDASSTAECQDACTNFIGCNFYSYDPVTAECFMFDTCPALDDTFCPDCVSGSPGCENNEEGNITMKRLEIIYRKLLFIFREFCHGHRWL